MIGLFKSIRFWIVVLFVTLIIGLRCWGLQEYCTFQYFAEQREYLHELVMQRHSLAVLLFIAWLMIGVMFALPVTAFSTVAGGFLFGVVPGALYSLIGATLGAVACFLLVRYAIGLIVQDKYRQQLVWFNEQMHRFGTRYLLAIHSVIVVPFFLVNILAGLTRVSLWTFTWTTAVGMIPITFILSFAGKELIEVNSWHDLLSRDIIAAIVLLGALGAISIVLQHRYGKKNYKT